MNPMNPMNPMTKMTKTITTTTKTNKEQISDVTEYNNKKKAIIKDIHRHSHSHSSTQSTRRRINRNRRIRTPHPFTRIQNPSHYEILKMIVGVVSGLVLIKLVLIIITILIGGSITILFHKLLNHKHTNSTQLLILNTIKVYSLRMTCRFLLLICGFYSITVVGEIPNTNKKCDGDVDDCCPKIIVSNHLSNIEILHLLTLPFFDVYYDDDDNSSDNDNNSDNDNDNDNDNNNDTNSNNQTTTGIRSSAATATATANNRNRNRNNRNKIKIIPCLPVFVTKESVFQIPIIGTITKDVLGSIGVSRSCSVVGSNTRNNLTEQIIERVSKSGNNSTTTTSTTGTRTSRGGGQGPIVIFPEGTTTNGTCLIDFKTGAFVPLLNILPICYSFVDKNSKKNNCDNSSNETSKSKSKSLPSFIPTYESIWTPVYIVRLLCQPYNRLKCEILPIQSPPSTPTSTSTSTSTSTPKPTQSSSSSSTSTSTPLSTSTPFSTPTPAPLSTSTSLSLSSSSLSSPQSTTTQTQQKLQLQHVLYANLVRQQMADTLQVPLVNNINYSPHKVQYHTLLRHQYKNTNKYYHPIYAMFFQPMQKVLPLLPTSRIEEEEEEEGAVLVEVEDNNSNIYNDDDDEKDVEKNYKYSNGNGSSDKDNDDEQEYEYEYDTVIGITTTTTAATATATTVVVAAACSNHEIDDDTNKKKKN